MRNRDNQPTPPPFYPPALSQHKMVPDKWRAMNPHHCPVKLVCGYGISLGACWHYLKDGVCPDHGRIYV